MTRENKNKFNILNPVTSDPPFPLSPDYQFNKHQ